MTRTLLALYILGALILYPFLHDDVKELANKHPNYFGEGLPRIAQEHAVTTMYVTLWPLTISYKIKDNFYGAY